MPIDTCTHCGAQVLFTTEYCPSCHTSRLTGALEPGFTSRIRAGVVAGENPLAGRGARLGAVLLDQLFAMLLAVPGTVILISAEGDDDATILTGIIVIAIPLLAYLVYQLYLLITTGQTIAKRMVGIRIVNHDDGRKPDFVHIVVLRSWVPGLIGAIPLFGPAFALIDALFIFGEQRRCIHDQMAGTKVVTA